MPKILSNSIIWLNINTFYEKLPRPLPPSDIPVEENHLKFINQVLANQHIHYRYMVSKI